MDIPALVITGLAWIALSGWLAVRVKLGTGERAIGDWTAVGVMGFAVGYALFQLAPPLSTVSSAGPFGLLTVVSIGLLQLSVSALSWHGALKAAGVERTAAYCFRSTLAGRALGVGLPSSVGLDLWLVVDAWPLSGRPVLLSLLFKRLAGPASYFLFVGLMILPSYAILEDVFGPDNATQVVVWSLFACGVVVLGFLGWAAAVWRWVGARAVCGVLQCVFAAVVQHALVMAMTTSCASIALDEWLSLESVCVYLYSVVGKAIGWDYPSWRTELRFTETQELLDVGLGILAWGAWVVPGIVALLVQLRARESGKSGSSQSRP